MHLVMHREHKEQLRGDMGQSDRVYALKLLVLSDFISHITIL